MSQCTDVEYGLTDIAFTLQLKDNVQITGITVEHIPKELSPNGNLDSAPKDIMLVVS